jgi:hypothetical protein
MLSWTEDDKYVQCLEIAAKIVVALASRGDQYAAISYANTINIIAKGVYEEWPQEKK